MQSNSTLLSHTPTTCKWNTSDDDAYGYRQVDRYRNQISKSAITRLICVIGGLLRVILPDSSPHEAGEMKFTIESRATHFAVDIDLRLRRILRDKMKLQWETMKRMVRA